MSKCPLSLSLSLPPSLISGEEFRKWLLLWGSRSSLCSCFVFFSSSFIVSCVCVFIFCFSPLHIWPVSQKQLSRGSLNKYRHMLLQPPVYSFELLISCQVHPFSLPHRDVAPPLWALSRSGSVFVSCLSFILRCAQVLPSLCTQCSLFSLGFLMTLFCMLR